MTGHNAVPIGRGRPMLRLDWNALRTGDRVLVHHATDGDDFDLVAGVVTAVTAPTAATTSPSVCDSQWTTVDPPPVA